MVNVNSLILGMSALGQFVSSGAYHLKQFENADYRAWTREEITIRVGATDETLEPYRCDGVQEFELFPTRAGSIGKSGSLQVKLQTSGSVLTYEAGEFYRENGDRAGRLSDSFGETVRDALREIEKTPSGSILIQRISNSPYPVQLTQGDPRFGPANDAGVAFRGLDMAQAMQTFVTLRKPDYAMMQFTRIGTGGYLFFNPKGNYLSIEEDGVSRKTPNSVIIAHEMYHAFDSVRGLLDRRYVYGKNYEGLEVSEFRAVRFENTFRKELGQRYRKFYGKGEAGGVLDENGRPHIIPAPCLM